MKKFLFGAFATVCAAFSFAAVNINTASSAELEALPGIGPAKAKSIVEYRQKNGAFKSVEELTDVCAVYAAPRPNRLPVGPRGGFVWGRE